MFCLVPSSFLACGPTSTGTADAGEANAAPDGMAGGGGGQTADSGGGMSDDAGIQQDSDVQQDAGPWPDAGGNAIDGATAGDGIAPTNDGGFVPPTGMPATVLLDAAELSMVRQQLAGNGGSDAQRAAFQNLIAAANDALTAGTWTVTSKAAAYVAKGDPHTYVSWGPYWWPPDASPPGGLGTTGKCPYVQHDGIHNPTIDKISDRHGLHASSEAIFELALAWFFTGKTAYADQAELVARTWYLNAATAMAPNMDYAQTHGPCGAGNAAGLIEGSGGYMTDALDGLAILAADTRPNGWTGADQMGMQSWMKQFLGWLQSSALAQAENAALNNHGSWYDALVSSLMLFTGDTAGAAGIANGAKTKRIDKQIGATGGQAQELARTTSWHYSNYNVAALCRLAGVAKHVGVDLWGYTSPSGGSIAKAIDFLIPTATTGQPPGPWAMYNDITMPFDSAYQAEAFYSVHAAAQFANDTAAQAVFAASPVAIQVPGHFCAGNRFPTGSDFCGITPGAVPASFVDLQSAGTPAIDMWPLIGTCRVPID